MKHIIRLTEKVFLYLGKPHFNLWSLCNLIHLLSPFSFFNTHGIQKVCKTCVTLQSTDTQIRTKQLPFAKRELQVGHITRQFTNFLHFGPLPLQAQAFHSIHGSIRGWKQRVGVDLHPEASSMEENVPRNSYGKFATFRKTLPVGESAIFTCRRQDQRSSQHFIIIMTRLSHERSATRSTWHLSSRKELQKACLNYYITI